MREFDFVIKSGSGKYTNLDKEYKQYVNNIMRNSDEDIKSRWETYNLIIEELIKEGRIDLFQEVKYRLTDNEDPNSIMLDIIDKTENQNSFIYFFKKRILGYKDEDFIKRFF